MSNTPQSDKSLAFDVDEVPDDSEDMYEVEAILDRKPDKKGFLYLVKWENFSEAQATWEPEDHLDNVKWLVDQFNAKFGKQQAAKKKLEREKLTKLSERKRRKEEKRRCSDTLDFQRQMNVGKRLDSLGEDDGEVMKKVQKLDSNTGKVTREESSPDPTASLPVDQAKNLESVLGKTRGILQKKRFSDSDGRIQSKISFPEVQKPSHTVEEAEVIEIPETLPKGVGIRMVRGNLALDVAVKILGCRKRGKTIEYAVLFKKRSDDSLVVIPQICTHEELKVQAPWLLSQYLLDSARIED